MSDFPFVIYERLKCRAISLSVATAQQSGSTPASPPAVIAEAGRNQTAFFQLHPQKKLLNILTKTSISQEAVNDRK